MKKQSIMKNIKHSLKTFSLYDLILCIALIITTVNYKSFAITASYRKPNKFMEFIFYLSIFYPVLYFLKQKSKLNLLFFSISGFGLLILANFFKNFFYIPRPDKLERVLNKLLKNPFKTNEEFESALKQYISKSHNSFPSAHATFCTFSVFSFFRIVSISSPLNRFGRKIRVCGILVVISVCLGRVLSNKHRFEDVFCGFGVGYLYSKCVLIFYSLFIKYTLSPRLR